ncbi:CBL-interacting serine/threonine-protein kinase 25 [Glycine soja]|uniref:CBL-interacting serine/threonine-protein kinase 25 n=1 Tax=Glycine soja TaxID=3848 RepID=A0A445FRK2_GLYSO|nr:CBL-interacting serine/threonine-protein kinase 25 [Glycine soja]
MMTTGLRGRSYGHCSSLPPPSSRGDVEEARSPVTAVLVVAAEEVPIVTRALPFGVSFRPVVFVTKVTSGTTSDTSGQHENLMTMYNKVLRAEFEFPPWFSPESKKLISKIVVADPAKRTTIFAITRVLWFGKGFSSFFAPDLCQLEKQEALTQKEDSSSVHVKVLHDSDCGKDCDGDVGAKVPRGRGQGLQDLTAWCDRGEEEEADGHGGGVRGGTRGHFRDKDNRIRGLLIQPAIDLSVKFFNWVESPHEHSHFQPVVDNTINAFHCLIESNHKDHPDLQSQTRHHPKSNPNPFSILLFTKIYNPNPSRSLSFSACTTTLTPPTSSQFSQWKAWGRLLFFAHFWIVTIICEERSKGLMALVRMVRRP